VRWDAMGCDARLFLICFDRRQSLSILKPLIQNSVTVKYCILGNRNLKAREYGELITYRQRCHRDRYVALPLVSKFRSSPKTSKFPKEYKFDIMLQAAHQELALPWSNSSHLFPPKLPSSTLPVPHPRFSQPSKPNSQTQPSHSKDATSQVGRSRLPCLLRCISSLGV